MTRVDVAGMRVGYYEPVDRHGLRPRDDKSGSGCVAFVIARRERSEGRGNPSCLGGRGRVVHSVTGSRWIATGLRPRDDKGGEGA